MSPQCPHCGIAIAASPPGVANTHCGSCGGSLEVATDVPEATIAWQAGNAPVATPAGDADDAEFVEPLPDDAPASADGEAYVPPRRIPFEVIFFLSALVLLLGVGTAAVAALLYFQRDALRDAGPDSGGGWSPDPYVSTSNSSEQKPKHWLNAGDGALRVGTAKVEILRAEYGEARGKDATGAVIISDEHYVHILVRVENTGFTPLKYRSWYGNDFLTENGPFRVRLIDDREREYPWIIFDDVERVRWNLPEATIEPGKYIDDVIIFEPPAEVDRASVDYVRLELPAAATGHEGFYYFELPRDMIDGF